MTARTPAISRHPTVRVRVGRVTVGGDAPIVVQSMTNTDTADAVRTAIADRRARPRGLRDRAYHSEQRASGGGRSQKSASAWMRMGVDVPLVGDFHFNGHKLLARYPTCAEALAKLRINPGNVGRRRSKSATHSSQADDRGGLPATTSPCASGSIGGVWIRTVLARLFDANARPARSRWSSRTLPERH
jgi:(E)-4-hydroxy-3-methylbut-2-enyl-diphosphate synthase